jgi:hypothetical protein
MKILSYNEETSKRVTEVGIASLAEIMEHLDKNFTVGTHGRLIPKNPGPDIVIIDHLNLLK